MGTEELRDKIFEMARRPEKDEVIAVEYRDLKLLVSENGVLVRTSEGWEDLYAFVGPFL